MTPVREGICPLTAEVQAGRGGTLLELRCDRPLGSRGSQHRQHHARVMAADGEMLSIWWEVER
jgi:hypothetical protein